MDKPQVLDIDDTKADLGKYSSLITQEDLDDIVQKILPLDIFTKYSSKDNVGKLSVLLDFVRDKYIVPLENIDPDVAEDIKLDLDNIKILTKNENRVDLFIDEIASMFVKIDQTLEDTNLNKEDQDLLSIIFSVCLDLLV